jgi:hypothetical protein
LNGFPLTECQGKARVAHDVRITQCIRSALKRIAGTEPGFTMQSHAVCVTVGADLPFFKVAAAMTLPL